MASSSSSNSMGPGMDAFISSRQQLIMLFLHLTFRPFFFSPANSFRPGADHRPPNCLLPRCGARCWRRHSPRGFAGNSIWKFVKLGIAFFGKKQSSYFVPHRKNIHENKCSFFLFFLGFYDGHGKYKWKEKSNMIKQISYPLPVTTKPGM